MLSSFLSRVLGKTFAVHPFADVRNDAEILVRSASIINLDYWCQLLDVFFCSTSFWMQLVRLNIPLFFVHSSWSKDTAWCLHLASSLDVTEVKPLYSPLKQQTAETHRFQIDKWTWTTGPKAEKNQPALLGRLYHLRHFSMWRRAIDRFNKQPSSVNYDEIEGASNHLAKCLRKMSIQTNKFKRSNVQRQLNRTHICIKTFAQL